MVRGGKRFPLIFWETESGQDAIPHPSPLPSRRKVGTGSGEGKETK
jgi:hypothetical protein